MGSFAPLLRRIVRDRTYECFDDDVSLHQRFVLNGVGNLIASSFAPTKVKHGAVVNAVKVHNRAKDGSVTVSCVDGTKHSGSHVVRLFGMNLCANGAPLYLLLLS